MSQKEFPFDVGLKYEPTNRHHRDLVRNNRDASLVVPFRRSGWFRRNDRDDLLHPEQILVLSSMEQDKYRRRTSPEEDFECIRDVRPDVCFPGDRWTYKTMTPRENKEQIKQSIEDALEVKRLVDQSDVDVTFYPVIMGWKRWHFERSRILFQEFDTRCCAFDVTGYRNIDEVVEDLAVLIETLDPKEIFLNGRLATNHLKKCPPEVVAASGKSNWVKALKRDDGTFSRSRLPKYLEERRVALSSVQTKLEQFGGQEVNIHG